MHALFAIRSGARVIHLDRDEKPTGASVRNFGLVWVSGRSPGRELRLALRSRELWEQVGQDVPETGFRANGSITLASTESELKVLEGTMARADATRPRTVAARLRRGAPAEPGNTGRISCWPALLPRRGRRARFYARSAPKVVEGFRPLPICRAACRRRRVRPRRDRRHGRPPEGGSRGSLCRSGGRRTYGPLL